MPICGYHYLVDLMSEHVLTVKPGFDRRVDGIKEKFEYLSALEWFIETKPDIQLPDWEDFDAARHFRDEITEAWRRSES